MNIPVVSSLSVLLPMALFLCACSKEDAVVNVTPKVQVETVRYQNNSEVVRYSGEIRGRYETPLSFQVNGRLIQRNVRAGEFVTAGQLLMSLDPRDLQQNLEQQNAMVNANRAEFELAQRNLAQYRDLYSKNFISQAEFDRHQTGFETARARLTQAQASSAGSRIQRNYADLRAPHAGMVAEIMTEPGQVVQVGQTNLILVRDGELEVEISVPEHRLDHFRRANNWQVSLWALPGVKVLAHLRELLPTADKQTRTYMARLTLKSPPAEVRLGMTASVESEEKAQVGGISVPLTALWQKDKQAGVWLVQRGKVVLQPVTLGSAGNSRVTVLSGLSGGEQVVIAGVHKLSQGMAVQTTTKAGQS